MTDETRPELKTLALALCAELPGQWTPVFRYECGCRLQRADGLTLFLSWWYNSKARPEVSIDVPNDPNGSAMSFNSWGVLGSNEKTPRASFDPARPAKAVAAQIVRSVIVPGEPLWLKVQERIAARLQAQAEAASAADLIAAAISKATGKPVSDRNGRGRGGEATFSLYEFPCVSYGEVRVNSGGSVDLNLRSMGAADAAAVLAFLTQRRKARS